MISESNQFPRLRSDLKWTLHEFADGPSYTVVDPTTGLNYQLGLAEYALVSLFDGQTSIADAAAATRSLASRNGQADLAVADDEAVTIASWLIDRKLVTSGRAESVSPAAGTRGRVRVSPLSVKMPLGDPSRLIDSLSRHTRLLTTRLALIGYLLLIIAAGIQVLCDLDRWSVALAPLVDPNAWWIIGLVALALRAFHEAAHGVVAHRFDVRVGEVGILWILLMPLPYVDVSGSWQRNRRRERILISAAGMLAEMVVAAVAVFVFTSSSSELGQHLAATVAVTASVVTLLFNANVLMRFDGYHILVDAIGLPNLYPDATSYWRATAARVILGKSVSPGGVPTGWRGHVFRAYGIGALGWRIVVFVGLVLAAEHLLGGAGVLLGVAAVVGMAVGQLRGLPRLLTGTRPLRALLGVVVTACIVAALWKLPISSDRTETGVARYRDASHVRAGSDGFVRELLVRRGQAVRSGEPLVALENRALESEVATLRLELSTARIRYRQFLSDNEMASAEAQWSSIVQLAAQLDQRERQLDGLIIRAEADGAVTAPDDLSLWLGRYVREGTELMRIVRQDEMEVVLLVDQPSRELWSDHVGRQVKVRRPIDWEDGMAVLSEVAPRATDQLPSEALGAHGGGSLAVRPSSVGKDKVRLLYPRFEARLEPEANIGLRDGGRVVVTMPTGGRTVGEVISDTATDWCRGRLARHSLLHQLSNF